MQPCNVRLSGLHCWHIPPKLSLVTWTRLCIILGKYNNNYTDWYFNNALGKICADKKVHFRHQVFVVWPGIGWTVNCKLIPILHSTKYVSCSLGLAFLQTQTKNSLKAITDTLFSGWVIPLSFCCHVPKPHVQFVGTGPSQCINSEHDKGHVKIWMTQDWGDTRHFFIIWDSRAISLIFTFSFKAIELFCSWGWCYSSKTPWFFSILQDMSPELKGCLDWPDTHANCLVCLHVKKLPWWICHPTKSTLFYSSSRVISTRH